MEDDQQIKWIGLFSFSRRTQEDLLLALISNGGSVSSGTLGVLSADLEAPPMSETSMKSDLLDSLDVFSESGVEVGRGDLAEFTVLEVKSLVKEPLGESITLRLAHNLGDALDLLVGHFTGADVKRDTSLLAKKD